MRKKNKLYTANKWNQPLFAQGVDRENQNIFDGFSSSRLDSFFSNQNHNVTGSILDTPYDYSYLNNLNANSFGKTNAFGSQLVGNYDTSSLSNTTLKTSPSSTSTSSSGGNNLMSQYGGALTSALGSIGTSEKYKRGMFDIADPLYHLAGGKESAVGNGLSDAGVGLFKAGAQTGNGALLLAGGIAKGAGSLWNTLAGTKWNKENIASIESNNTALKKAASRMQGVDTSSDLLNAAENMTAGLNFNMSTIGSKGPLAGHKLDRKYNGLKTEQNRNLAILNHATSTAMNRVDRNIDEIAQTNNVAAYGGYLGDNNSGAIDYNFMSDYLTAKNKAAGVKDKVGNNIFGSLQASPYGIYALGGDIQSNGSDFSNGLAHIDAGGSHEESPYDGVQVGISRENGQPNLVEEGETIFDDYVFSKRIKVDADTKKKFHLGKKADLTFADVSKKLEKESLERPNDAISQAALTKQLHSLAEEQERQKAEEEQRKLEEAQEMFEQLPPEQQQAIIQQAAMEQQQAQQQQEAQQAQAMQEQQMQQQQMQGQEDPQAMQQQQMEEQQQAVQPQMDEQLISAYGGCINRFDKGGDMKSNIYKALGISTDPDFNEWRKKYNVGEITDWENILQNEAFMDALKKSSPALRDALAHNYDFGTYKANQTAPYDLAAFNKVLDAYTASKNQGNTDDHYAPDEKFDLQGHKDLSDLEADPKYKAYTDYLVGVANRVKGKAYKFDGESRDYKDIVWKDKNNTFSEDDYNALRTLQHHIDGTSTYPNGDPVKLWGDADTDGYSSILDNAGDLISGYKDANGEWHKGLRTDQIAGIFHLTPEAKNRNKVAKNIEIDGKGNTYEIYGDVPKDWKKTNSYTWQDKDNDNVYNYYMRPDNIVGADKAKGDQRKFKAVYKPTWGRTVGMLGPGIALAMQQAGIGYPDVGMLDKVLKSEGNDAYTRARYLGNYLQYRPMDIWQEQNRMDASGKATDRAIANSSTPFAAKMAGLVANAYNQQNSRGTLLRQGLDYNNSWREKQATFNRGTDQFNAETFNNTSKTNAEIANSSERFWNNLAFNIANTKLGINKEWNQAKYANLGNLASNLSKWGKENAQFNMISDMAENGLFANATPDTPVFRNNLAWVDEDDKKKKRNGSIQAAQGGKLNRKKGRRGLTF